jgi:hypothetical protein
VGAAHIFLNERLLALPQVRLYSGLVDGSVVATSMLVAAGPVAGIYWVATIEPQRGKGDGEALTWAAAAGGRELGCTIAPSPHRQMSVTIKTPLCQMFPPLFATLIPEE